MLLCRGPSRFRLGAAVLEIRIWVDMNETTLPRQFRTVEESSWPEAEFARNPQPLPTGPATMFCRSVKSTATPLRPLFSSFSSTPSSLNSSFLNLRKFSQSAAIMSKVFFDVQYAPVGSSTRKFTLSSTSKNKNNIRNGGALPLIPVFWTRSHFLSPFSSQFLHWILFWVYFN